MDQQDALIELFKIAMEVEDDEIGILADIAAGGDGDQYFMFKYKEEAIRERK